MISSSDRPAVRGERRTAAVQPAAWALEELETLPPDEGGYGAADPGPGRTAAPEKTVADWEREIEEAYARGRAEGVAAGKDEGRAEGRREEAARLGSAVQALEDALFMVRTAEEHRLGMIHDNLVALAAAIARKLVGRELRSDADAVSDLVRRALVEFPIDQPLRVRLSPRDLSTISALPPAGAEPVPIAPGRDLRWLADPRLEPGDCIIEGKDRIVDGRVDRALERVYRSLTDD